MRSSRPVTQRRKFTMPPMTPTERSIRFNAIALIGRIACRQKYRAYSPCIIHHLCGLDSTRKGLGGKADDRETIGLCAPHHKGSGVGVSYHDAPETWEKIFGTQQDLLAITNGYIEKQIRYG